MRYYYIFLIYCFLQLIVCEEGGVKFIVDQRFIDAAHKKFVEYFRDGLNKIDLPDIGPVEEVELRFPNLKPEHIVLKFENNGIFYLKIKDIIPRITGTVYYRIVFKFHNNVVLELRDFHLEGKIKIKSKIIENKRYILDAEFISKPTFQFKADLDADGIGGSMVAKWFERGINIGLKLALPRVEQLCNELLQKYVISKIPKSVVINTPKAAYNLDLTLPSPINIRNNFLELNTYALLYYEKDTNTKMYNRYPLTNLPSITKPENQLQLYISEYSIKSALYTLFSVNREIKFELSTKQLDVLIPNIVNEYGNRMANATIYLFLDPKVNITDKYLDIKTRGSLYIDINGAKQFSFGGRLELQIKVEAKVVPGPKISGKLYQLEGKLSKVYVGNKKQTNINNAFQFIEEVIRPAVNLFIEHNIPFKIPELLGVEFKDLSIEHKDHYLMLNYNIMGG